MNTTEIFKNKTFPCPLCEKKLDIRISEKEKPYLVCEDCGIQLFIRKDAGIRKLKNKLNFWW